MLKDRAISAHLLALEKNDIDGAMKRDLSNNLSVLVVRMIDNVEGAKSLLEQERDIIQERGLDGDYLFQKDASVQDIFQSFYKHRRIDDQGMEVLGNDLMLSEMMMMLGTFSRFSEERSSHVVALKKSMQKAQRRISKKGVYAFFPLEEKDEDFLTLHIETLRQMKLDEYQLGYYMNQQSWIIMEGILRRLGINPEDVSKEQCAKITAESRRLCAESMKLECFFVRRKRRSPAVSDDISFLSRQGETTKRLASVLLCDEEDVKEKVYRI